MKILVTLNGILLSTLIGCATITADVEADDNGLGLLGVGMVVGTPAPTATGTNTPAGTATPTPTITPTATATPNTELRAWANDGGDKVSQDDMRLVSAQNVTNAIWNGSSINVSGARQEVVGFNVVLESPTSGRYVQVQTSAFSCGGQTITPEKFKAGYLEIKGLSRLSYEAGYDERHVPIRLRRPWTGEGVGSGGWTDRPDHNKFYPDPLIPINNSTSLLVASNRSQSIWVDLYIPKTTTAGACSTSITILVDSTSIVIPVNLTVHNFTLFDRPSLKTMVYMDERDINRRFIGNADLNSQSEEPRSLAIRDEFFKMAHAHRISLVSDDWGWSAAPTGRPRDAWIPRLDGTLYTSGNGYTGPGEGVGEDLYVIGMYGQWPFAKTQSAVNSGAPAWKSWFDTNYPNVENFFYLIDESADYAQTQTWASWFVPHGLKTFATLNLANAVNNVPDLSIPASWFTTGTAATWETAFNALKAASKKVYFYNGKRPSNGSFATEDDGIALRELAWAQAKFNIDRWFFWSSNYWYNYQGGTGHTPMFSQAMTFGSNTTSNYLGETGWNYSNGDGVLFYPGNDAIYPSDSLGIDGPIASLRLKMWRRGIQDGDYITLARGQDSAATNSLIATMVPKALWEYGVNDPNDPTWVKTDISWSTSPDDWEAARQSLVAIINPGGPTSTPSPTPTRTPTRTPTHTPTVTPTNVPFDLNSYCTVLGWHDFSDATKSLEATGDPAEDGDGIQIVTTKGTSPISGDANQATSGDRPINSTAAQNGLQVGRFNGTSHFLQLANGRDTLKNLSAATFVVVYSADGTTSARSLFEIQGGTGGHRLKLYHEFNPNQWGIDMKRADADSGQNFYSGSGNLPVAQTWYIAVGVIDLSANTVKLWINGTQKINATPTGSGSWSNTDSQENPVIGANSLYDSQLWDGDIGEIGFCSGAMDDTNRNNLETALGTKWGITVQ